VEILQTFPAMVIKVGRTQFAIDEELASHIMVKHI
jgi:Fe2+ transport system protein FeoA